MKKALESVDGVADIKTVISDRSCTFSAPKGLDVKAALNKLADDGNQHIKGWSNAE